MIKKLMNYLNKKFNKNYKWIKKILKNLMKKKS